MENQVNHKVKDNMITHLKHIFQDSMAYGFRCAKGAHAEILDEMEMGKINWLDMPAIAEIRKTRTQKPITAEELQERHTEVKFNDGRDIGQSAVDEKTGIEDHLTK
jgi:hypothetical protein